MLKDAAMTKKLQPIEPEVFENGSLPENRRGVLLLIVLSMLTLFMMLGTTYLVVASRAKATAKAFANSGEFSKTARAASGERLVNEAFLRIARGSSSTMPDLPAGDDLLGDKYGTSSRTGNVISASGSTVITLEVNAIAPAVTTDVSELAGCVLTFTLPDLSNISVRIIRAEDNNANNPTNPISLFIPGGLTASGENITSQEITAAKLKRPSSSLDFIINGREFSGIAGTNKNESWDGFDSENPFLAQILPSATAPFTPTVERSSFKGKPPASPTPADLLNWIDNDGDGVIDSQWLDLGFPMFVDKNGTSFKAKAAVLVLDLDGRINLNAHGSRTDVENPSNNNEFNIGKNFYPDVTANPMGGGMPTLIVPMATLPRGAGRGPAEISVAASKVTGDINGTGLPEMLSGDQGPTGQTRTNPDAATGREKPKLNRVEGRYGDTPWNPNTSPLLTAKPGVSNSNDNQSFDQWVGTKDTIFFLDTASRYYSSPSDLKGRMRIWVDEFGQPNYYKPYWNAATGNTEDSNRLWCDDEVVDDPYEVRLGRNGFRTGWIHDPSTGGLSTSAASAAADNLYTPADLEGILRYLDADSLKLPRRLVSLSRDWASQNRLSVTTESWDSPVVGSSAFMNAVAQLASRTPTSYLMFSPETLMGHRIDLNRPFHDTSTYEPNDGLANDGLGKSRRQTFAKHLYAAAYALAGNGVDITPAEARELAQWAINMVDFRDTDTTITGFEFDTTLTDGWQVDNDLATNDSADLAVVWGCERPEILLTEAICWHDRGTEDAAIGGTLVDKDTTQRDDDFDQKRRPQGAFFFELYSPWQSRAFEFDNASNAKSVKDGSSPPEDVRGEPVPRELDASTNPMGNESPGYSTSARLDLARKSSGGCPVWRIVSVKRSTRQSYGPPALKPNVNDPGDASLGANTPVVHRVFYFTQPPASLSPANGDPPVFWCNQTFLPLDPHQPLSFGTPAVRTGITQNSGAFAQVAIDTVYDSSNNSPQTRPATLTEPVAQNPQNPKDDPYHILAQSLGSGLAGNSSQLQSTVDQPLDDVSAPGINPLLGPDGARVLFQNGRHANFFFLHLQRLADPTQPWNAKTNPYQTIDTLPVDLTVVNYDGIGANAANHDEPCVVPGSNPPTPGGPFVDLFDKQRDYGPISVERGNTIATPANYDFDIWSARVYAGAPTNNDNDYLLLSSGDLPSQRDALPVQESPNPQQDATLRAAPQPTKTNSFNLLASRFGAGNSGVPSRPFPWLFWANRPFNSAVEVAMVPRTSSFELLRKHSTANAAKPFGHLPGFFDTAQADLAAPWTVITGRTNVMMPPIPPITSFLDLVHVASPFSDIYGSAPSNMLTSVGLDVFPYNQFSHFREPGRVNVNTVTSKNVWEALFGKTDPASLPAWNKDLLSGSGSPAKSLLEVFQKIKDPTVPKLGFLDFHNDEISFEDTNHDGILDMGEDTNANGILDMGEDTNANGVLDTPNDDYRNTDKNIFFRYQTMNRLANNVTVRSNVFAIWITVGFFENGGTKELGSDTGEIDRHRGFFLFDRSIPVGYETGKDHNVTDAVLLRRIIP